VPSYEQTKRLLQKEARKNSIPLFGEFELTSRCNFSCPMCYVHTGGKTADLSTEAWKAIFTEAVQAGMLYALLTGGEALLRPDFLALYNYLYDLGVRITVYTNGSLITEEVVAAFVKRPPELVGITVYGADPETVALVTKNPQGFAQTDQGIDRLVAAKVALALRTIPIQPIYQKLDTILAYVRSKGLFLGYQLYVAPKRGCSALEKPDRLSPEELLRFEETIRKVFPGRVSKDFIAEETDGTCAALKSASFITWEGIMQPCSLIDFPAKKVIPGQYLATFRELRTKMESLSTCSSCAACTHRDGCLQCYARRSLEGDRSQCPAYLRAIAQLRTNKPHA